jgi:hypothetical protein
MRSVLQLRTPQNGNGDQHSVGSVNLAAAILRRISCRSTSTIPRKQHPRSVSASRKSKWRTEPEARPAAGSSKACSPASFRVFFRTPGRRRPSRFQRHTHRNHHRQFRGQAAELSRRLHRRAGGEWNGKRPRGLGSAGRGYGGHLCTRSRFANTRSGGEVRAMGNAARKAGVTIAGGDTKVVEHGKADFMYITTTGIGRTPPGIENRSAFGSPGRQDSALGPIGDHGITILLARGELDLRRIFVPTRAPCFL